MTRRQDRAVAAGDAAFAKATAKGDSRSVARALARYAYYCALGQGQFARSQLIKELGEAQEQEALEGQKLVEQAMGQL